MTSEQLIRKNKKTDRQKDKQGERKNKRLMKRYVVRQNKKNDIFICMYV